MSSIPNNGILALYKVSVDSLESTTSYTTEKQFVPDEKIIKPQHEFVLTELKQIGIP